VSVTKIRLYRASELKKLSCMDCGGLDRSHGADNRIFLNAKCHHSGVDAIYDKQLNVLALFCHECHRIICGIEPK
jgi:hypothetical protein